MLQNGGSDTGEAMRPTAIGAPDPEPGDDKPTLEELLAKMRARSEKWQALMGLTAQIAEARAARGPVRPAPDEPD